MEAVSQGVHAGFYWAAKGMKWEAGLTGLMGTRIRLTGMGTDEWSGTRAAVGQKGMWHQWEALKSSLLGTAVEAEV